MTDRPLILGGGPAGLTAAHLLASRGKAPLVLEALDRVRGLARTEVRDGYRFDIGGHRFFTKSREMEALWLDAAGHDLWSVNADSWYHETEVPEEGPYRRAPVGV